MTSLFSWRSRANKKKAIQKLLTWWEPDSEPCLDRRKVRLLGNGFPDQVQATEGALLALTTCPPGQRVWAHLLVVQKGMRAFGLRRAG